MMDIITSKSNEKAKFIKSLNDKKSRQKNNCFYIEGIKVVEETIINRKAIDIMFIAYSEELLMNINGGEQCLDNVISYCENNDVKILNFTKEVFLSITDTVTSQGILCVIKIEKYNLLEELDNSIVSNKNILFLDKIQDAGNMGTIIRTCDAFGIDLILCNLGCVDCYLPKVVRSTMASILREKIIYIDYEELKKVNDYLKQKKYKIIGTTLNDKSIDLEDLDFNDNYLFVMGNEANGVSMEVLELCDKYVKIEMSGRSESLNVGVATSIVLYKQFKNEKIKKA